MRTSLDHPVFSGTEAEWYSVEDLCALNDKMLADTIHAEQNRIAQYCTQIFASFIQPELLGTETLVPIEFLIKPMENEKRGFVSYLEFRLPSSQRCDSDSWWMIVGCPDTTKTVVPEIRYYPWSFGWFCQRQDVDNNSVSHQAAENFSIFLSSKMPKSARIPPMAFATGAEERRRSLRDRSASYLEPDNSRENEDSVFPPVGRSFFLKPSRWTLRLGLGGLLVLLAVVWVGADRVPANATRPIVWQGPAEQQKSLPGKSFRVASFNIHGGKGRDHRLDLGRIGKCLAEVRADFVGLNEVHGTCFGTRLDQAAELGQDLNMAAIFVPTERRFWQPSFGNGLLSRVTTTPVHMLPLPCTQGKKYRTADIDEFSSR